MITRAALAFMLLTTPAIAQDETMTQETLNQWITAFEARAHAEGITPETLEQSLSEITFLPEVIERDRNQNEFSKTIWAYVDTAVSYARITAGQRALDTHSEIFDSIETTYGVDRHIIAAIWGLESSYGAVRGDVDTLSGLATLAHEGRRAAFFEAQLIAALTIIQDGDAAATDLRGSWAGAMGHTQFMPTTFQKLAVDFDGDGRRDIWGDDPTDALASTAAFLADAGWQSGQAWGVEVTLPEGFNYDQARRTGTRVPSAWATLGVQTADGSAIPDSYRGGSILLPAGHRGPAFMIFSNFRALEYYNRADAYVIAVGHLADRLRGSGSIQADWPRDDRALTFDERLELQELLTAAGHSTLGADGIIGPNTINAARRYQRGNGLVPDGYPSLALLEVLRQGSSSQD